MKDESRQARGIDSAIGEQVRRARVMLGWSQSKLGRAVGVSFQQIQKYESGTSKLSVSRLLLLAGVLNVPVSFLLEQKNYAARFVENQTYHDGSAQSGELLAAFLAINDVQVRGTLVELIQAMAAAYSATIG